MDPRINEKCMKKKIRLVSEMLRDKRKRLLGHTMRCEEKDPMYQVTFDKEGLKKFEDRRVGRPRGHWAETTIAEVIEDEENMTYERGNVDQLLLVFIMAVERRL